MERDNQLLLPFFAGSLESSTHSEAAFITSSSTVDSSEFLLVILSIPVCS